ncbi:MAG: tetratricopeptide repeat-containing sensor histidine kinase [Chitinophagaceae bacterium]
MKYLLLFLSIIFSLSAQPQQADTNYLKRLYDRCIDFDESKTDSLKICASIILKESARLHYDRGEVLSSRLNGIAEDLKGNYDSAIVYYFQSLDAARKLHAANYEEAALTDLAYVYVNTKQPARAKEMYLQSAKLAESENDLSSVITAYGNLGAIYNQLKQPDSALFFLNKGLAIAKPHEDKIDVSSFYSNMGNVYYEKKEYSKALGFFERNHALHVKDSNYADLWIDNLNIADVFIEMKNFDSGYVYAMQSLQMAQKMQARSKEADSYSMLSKLYFRKGDYKNAYEYQQKWYSIDTSLVNAGTNETIAGLQEKFNAKKREQDNQLLQSQVEKAHFRNKAITLLAVAAALIAVIISLLLIQKRKANKKLQYKNDFINRQNEKLAELNYEKNSLISIVSHDLSTPFAAIKMWLNILDDDTSNLTGEQKKAIERIRQSSGKGELLIRSILDVEKAETNQHRVELENFDLKVFVESIVGDFKPAASGKNIQLHFETPDKHVYLVSDKQLVSRICENLFSNAIKYSLPDKNVWISLSDTNDAVNIQVKDEGVGISKEELPNLFSKYSKISSRPTAGETSTGLGLSIVKRIVEELNGSVFCESEPGKGSLFTVVLKK